MLAEDTREHREIFGEDGDSVRYFNTAPEMMERLRRLLSSAEERGRLAQRARGRITGGENRYLDRLQTMMEADSPEA